MYVQRPAPRGDKLPSFLVKQGKELQDSSSSKGATDQENIEAIEGFMVVIAELDDGVTALRSEKVHRVCLRKSLEWRRSDSRAAAGGMKLLCLFEDFTFDFSGLVFLERGLSSCQEMAFTIQKKAWHSRGVQRGGSREWEYTGGLEGSVGNV